MPFSKEADFEQAIIKNLSEYGWEKTVLHNYTEEQLIQNWANILFENNRSIDRLNDYPLTRGEMHQIIDYIREQRTPIKLNGMIVTGHITIKRDNPLDIRHLGKEVSLKIYDRREIAAGQSRYQIANQIQFDTKSNMLSDRRGDLILLINGMPMIHIELKKSGIPVSQAINQIEKYANEGVYTGFFALIQIFVAMNPEETIYFANPGHEGKFNPDYYFHWADFNNEPIHDWKRIVSDLLSIPMAHELIGFYTVADKSDGNLKVMRSYQYYAASAISDRVSKTKWEDENQLGGFVWHTTGSGKTMTSFKSAQLIASSQDADKVIFLMDRIELGTQSLGEYRNFAEDSEEVQATENTGVLVTKLKSTDPSDTLIVTSIQKMSNINNDEGGLQASDIERINTKRIVFIVDECHRSTFGDMLHTIKRTFTRAIFFGFTGTPIQEENQKKMSTTSTVFGKELHRYSIADGIRDKNVLGFDPYKVCTFKDKDLREHVALEKSKASSVNEALSDPLKSEVYYQYMHLPMAGYADESDKYVKGIEDFIPNSQYETETHQNMVVQDILDNWITLSHNGKFHAILATGSIREAIEYYRLFKKAAPERNITALFDPNIDNNGGAILKEEALVEIITDYGRQFQQEFSIPTFYKMKKDIANRLAHKDNYARIDRTPDKQIDLLIVVDQMLTGYDSKWVNTLYIDKMLHYESVIQAFSRTNRLFGPEKPFGTIKYYRRPHTMEKNIEAAVKLYSGDKPLALFVERLYQNLTSLNYYHSRIKDLFLRAGVEDFLHLPKEEYDRKRFAEDFKTLNGYLEAARIQGFFWDKDIYDYTDPETNESRQIHVSLTEHEYKILALRYKELQAPTDGPDSSTDVPYDIDGYLTTIDTDLIDAEYMNSRFVKFLKLLYEADASAAAIKQAEEELHKTFATLTQEEQKFASIFLRDIQRGDVRPDANKSFRDYITEYISKNREDQIHKYASTFGLSEEKLRNLMALKVTEMNINEYGRFDELKATVDKTKAKTYLEMLEGHSIFPPKVSMKIDKSLRDFIISGGFDLEVPPADT